MLIFNKIDGFSFYKKNLISEKKLEGVLFHIPYYIIVE